MKPVHEWTEIDIQSLLTNQRPEDLSLEYKGAAALKKSDKTKAEISKDVSAMANSAGGVVIYGIDEQKSRGGPMIIDGINQGDTSIEYLEQVIDAGISRRIPGLRINQIQLSGVPGRVVYAVHIPQSSLAPHMASDHRYYKRLGTTTAFMEEYEVRDVARRSEAPDLSLDFACTRSSETISLQVFISNQSPEPAYHTNVRLYLPLSLTSHGLEWKGNGFDELVVSESLTQFAVVLHSWGVPENPPVLEGERYRMGTCLIDGPPILPCQLVWGIGSPKMKERLVQVVIFESDGIVRVQPQAAVVSRPKR